MGIVTNMDCVERHARVFRAHQAILLVSSLSSLHGFPAWLLMFLPVIPLRHPLHPSLHHRPIPRHIRSPRSHSHFLLGSTSTRGADRTGHMDRPWYVGRGRADNR